MIKNDELLLVVDENNIPIDPKPRHEVHKSGYWHRTSHIWIINTQYQILCQKRSLLKDSNPGKWEPFFGGHISPNEEYFDVAIRELNEEIGLKIDREEDLKLFKIYKNELGKEFQALYFTIWNGDINTLTLEMEEIDQVKWFSIHDISEKLIKNIDPVWSVMGYEKELLAYINSELEKWTTLKPIQ